MSKKLLTMMTAAVLSLSLLAGCGGQPANPSPAQTSGSSSGSAQQGSAQAANDGSLQYILDKGELVLGLDDSFPPMGFRDDKNEIVGFDIDVAKAVSEKLGVSLKLQPIDWKAKEQELATKQIDCLWNGFSINEERQKAFSMSIPYMDNHMALVVKKDSGIRSQADMKDKKLALQSGSTAEDALNDAADLKASLKEINTFDTNLTALMDLEVGASDAVLMDDVVANYMITENGKEGFEILSDFLYAEQYAIGFRKEDAALCQAVNEALRGLKADGTLGKIATEWFGSDTTVVE